MTARVYRPPPNPCSIAAMSWRPARGREGGAVARCWWTTAAPATTSPAMVIAARAGRARRERRPSSSGGQDIMTMGTTG